MYWVETMQLITLLPFISISDQDIQKLMVYYRRCFPTTTFPPKMHMLEEHVVPFIRTWKFPLGFFGEQGGESIHHDFVSLAATFNRVKPYHSSTEGDT